MVVFSLDITGTGHYAAVQSNRLSLALERDNFRAILSIPQTTYLTMFSHLPKKLFWDYSALSSSAFYISQLQQRCKWIFSLLFSYTARPLHLPYIFDTILSKIRCEIIKPEIPSPLENLLFHTQLNNANTDDISIRQLLLMLQTNP